jgi:anti-sigma factor RsiW
MKLIYAFLDGELDVKETGRVQNHLQRCASCRDEFAAEHTFLGLLKSDLRADPVRTKYAND